MPGQVERSSVFPLFFVALSSQKFVDTALLGLNSDEFVVVILIKIQNFNSLSFDFLLRIYGFDFFAFVLP